MSSSNSRAEIEPARPRPAPPCRRCPTPPARSRWRRSRAARRPRDAAGASAACRASGGRGGPRTDRPTRKCRLPRGNVSTSTSPASGNHRALGLQAQPLADRGRAAPPTAAGRPACGARARPGAWRAETCRPHRRGSSGSGSLVRETSASVSCRPSKRTTSPAKAKVSPTVSCSMKDSSSSPSTRPPNSGRGVPALCRRAAADQADLDHRRLDDGADVEAVLLGEARMGEPQRAVAASA